MLRKQKDIVFGIVISERSVVTCGVCFTSLGDFSAKLAADIGISNMRSENAVICDSGFFGRRRLSTPECQGKVKF